MRETPGTLAADPAAAFARETLRSRRRAALALAGLLELVGLGFLALTLWFTDEAHFRTFFVSAACLLGAGAGVFFHGLRLRVRA